MPENHKGYNRTGDNPVAEFEPVPANGNGVAFDKRAATATTRYSGLHRAGLIPVKIPPGYPEMFSINHSKQICGIQGLHKNPVAGCNIFFQ